MPLPAAAAMLLVLLTSACSGAESNTADGIDPNEPARPAQQPSEEGPVASERLPSKPRLGRVDIDLQRVAKPDEPTAMATRAGDDGIYVTDRQGLIQVVRGGKVTTLLDWRKRTIGGNEQGMLGLTFSPDGSRLYVYYIWQGDVPKVDQDSVLDEYRMDGDRLDPESRRELLRIKQPTTVHKAGQLTFGDDGMLYLSLGDGGPADVPPDTSQDLSTLLGKLIRIDPTPSGGRPYGIPRDNPYVQRDGARGEILATGLRNPWRFSLDRDSGDVWITDVGRYQLEEINAVPPRRIGGANFGWPYLEGTAALRPGAPENTVKPLLTYGRDDGRCAIIGGYVYRGTAVPGLRGAYLYSDFCDGQIRALVRRGGRVVQEAELGPAVPGMTSFGQDADGELYVLSLEEGLKKIVPAD